MPEFTAPTYSTLERTIRDLKEDFANPLIEEVITTPLWPVIQRIVNLPDGLEGLERPRIEAIEVEVRECRRLLDEISYTYVNEIISKPDPSRVFKILNNAKQFERMLKGARGKTLRCEDGTELKITPQVIKALTKYRFSLGTPPITPKGIETIERILFGGTLRDIYGFRDLLGIPHYLFDLFIGQVDGLIEQSTHYTTPEEKRAFEREGTEFINLEGARGFKRSTVSGNAKTAIRLINEHVLSQHGNGEKPLKIVERKDALDDELIAKMTLEKEKIFVVRVSKIPHNIFTSDVLNEKWKGVIGRLVLVEDSDNSRRAGTTFVYALNPVITRTLDAFHIKDSGTIANTQINLRRILEGFKVRDLEALEQSVDKKLAQFQKKGIPQKPADEVRKKEWDMSAQKDYAALVKFKKFLEFIKAIKTVDEEGLSNLQKELTEENRALAMDYFFGNLKKKGYECTVVPQGGGRRELGIIGKFQRQKAAGGVEEFKENRLAEARQRLEKQKRKLGIGVEGTDATEHALTRALADRQSPAQAIRENGHTRPRRLQAFLGRLTHEKITQVEQWTEEAIAAVDQKLGENVPGTLKKLITHALRSGGIEAASKIFERAPFRTFANKFRKVLGELRKMGVGITDKAEEVLENARHALEIESLDRAERMLNDIESGSFEPNLAVAEIGWTFNDVLLEDDFPAKNYLHIGMNEDGTLDPSSLREQLESMREALIDFPDLFGLYCQNTLLVINDPHNPTSKVMRPHVKLALLDIASEYGLTIISDEPYHKQVSKEVKEEQGDTSLAEFYEQNRARFPNPITIHTTLSTTKWAMGAGRRTGIVLSNDQEFREYAESQSDGCNIMSLYMDAETYRMGLTIKTVCQQLEEYILPLTNPALILKDAKTLIDEILGKNFNEPFAEKTAAAVYFKLMEIRNTLDRIALRGGNPLEVRQYLSEVVSELKNFRLDKQTQRDGENRGKAAVAAIKRVAKDHPGLEERCIKPEGPFYFCLKLDETGSDPALTAFLERTAAARKMDIVPDRKGYVRFAFGGETDGTTEGYDMLSFAIETDMRLLLRYWGEFKEKRAALAQQKDLDPVDNTLKQMFPGGEVELTRTLQDKRELVERIGNYQEKGHPKVAFSTPSNVAEYLAQIEPGSAASIITIRGVECQDVNDFIKSRPFTDLFNHYVQQVRGEIPALQHLDKQAILGDYGATRFREKFRTRVFSNNEKEIFAQIAIAVAQKWFSDDTIKILVDEGGDLLGKTETVQRFILEFLRAFISNEQEKALPIKPTFQVGYQEVHEVEAAEECPAWLKIMTRKIELAGKTVPTDIAPELVTGGTVRVAGFERGIYRRDGDGQNAPDAHYFSGRLGEFAETMNPKDWVAKMIQVGPTRLLMVMHRSYSHYLIEELRLFPQFNVSPEELKSLKPDAVSFLGLPSKVMGDDYRIGYFMDEGGMPVSWVDAEDITDYMGYLKKPILTMGNERVKTMGGMPVHGSALTITFKDGLRKTIVMAGDSGTGKSETLIAMVRQMIQQVGDAQTIESIELLAGDMLSMFTGADGQLYMMGTEEGDFMRMNDIPKNWEERFRDRLERASKTNLKSKNARQTISGLCNPDEFLRPVRVNMFFNINNFEEPAGEAFREERTAANLLTEEYVRGYRREKGTSGDQPNLRASVFYSKDTRRMELLEQHGENMDRLLNWEVIPDETGKVRNGILAFRDVPGEIFHARALARDLFEGREIEKNGKRWRIQNVKYDIRKNRFGVILESDGEKQEALLDRTIFDQIYNPIASTYCGDPFIHPEGMDAILKRFARTMQKTEVVTGTIFTRLAITGQEFEGPSEAARSLLHFLKTDPRINQRFQRNKRRIYTALREKYGEQIFGAADLPIEIQAHNLLRLERHESDTIRLVDESGGTINLKTPHYHYDSAKSKSEFIPGLITPELQQEIETVCQNPAYDRNLEDFRWEPSDYQHIKAWNNKEELIYQILLRNGVMSLGYPPNVLQRAPAEVKKAQKIAESIMAQRTAA